MARKASRGATPGIVSAAVSPHSTSRRPLRTGGGGGVPHLPTGAPGVLAAETLNFLEPGQLAGGARRRVPRASLSPQTRVLLGLLRLLVLTVSIAVVYVFVTGL